MQSGSNLLGLQLATKTDLVSMWSDFVFTNTLGPLRTISGALEVLPMEDELPDFSVYMVYRSADLMTHACAEFSKRFGTRRSAIVIADRHASASAPSARMAPGGRPTTRLNARLNAASDP